MKYLIAGLGNPGAEYELTRHNIGFLAADRLIQGSAGVFRLERLAQRAEFRYKGRIVHVIKPSTYMNLSGKALQYWIRTLDLPLANVLVVADDVALPFGKLRMRASGSDGGHNGHRSIAEVLGSAAYPRLRMGIGDEYHKNGQVNYVLGRFTEEEMTHLPEILNRARDMILSYCTSGIQHTMNQYNG